MKTIDPTASITAGLSKLASLETQQQNTEASLQTSITDRDARIQTTDLDDPKALDEISRLHVKIDLLPLRIAALGQSYESAKGELLQSGHDFISNTISPKVRDLLSRARAKARQAMKDQFNNEADLTAAIESSALVAELGNICPSIQDVPLGGPATYAHRLLESWQRVSLLERKLS